MVAGERLQALHDEKEATQFLEKYLAPFLEASLAVEYSAEDLLGVTGCHLMAMCVLLKKLPLTASSIRDGSESGFSRATSRST